jgi:hypothetical protein
VPLRQGRAQVGRSVGLGLRVCFSDFRATPFGVCAACVRETGVRRTNDAAAGLMWWDLREGAAIKVTKGHNIQASTVRNCNWMVVRAALGGTCTML